MSHKLYEQLATAPIVPTVYPMDAQILGGYAQTLADEGYPALEVLARPDEQAFVALEQVFAGPARQHVQWGLGTITTRAKAIRAATLRPDFIVSPAFSRTVLDITADADIPYIPAVSTFQDVQTVLDAFDERGLTVKVLKLCPVYDLSRDFIAALGGCFPGIQFCPTGEVTLGNYVEWKSRPGIIAPMGSRFIPSPWLVARDFKAVRERLGVLHTLANKCAE